MPSEELSLFAEFTAAASPADLPPQVKDQAGLVLLDTLGVIIRGSRAEAVPELTQALGRDESGTATCPGRAKGFSPLQAALINGVAGSSLEFEEGNSAARGHPAIQIIPAVLASAEAGGRSGAEVLTGLVLGYEAGARLSRSAQMRQGLHPTGTWGVVGSALGVGRTEGRTAEELVHIANLAASYTLTPYVMNSFAGYSAAATFAGLTNHHALLANILFNAGFRADPRSLEMTFGRFLSQGLDLTGLTTGLGRDWAITANYFKSYPSCRFSHGAVDALADILTRRPITAEEVEAIEVATFKVAAHPTPLPPANAEAMRFSLPYQLAALVIRGRLDLESMGPATLNDPRIAALAAKVKAFTAEEYEALRPERNPARVTLRLKDGWELSSEVMDPKGDPQARLNRAELEAKFLELAGPVIGRGRAATALERLADFEALTDIRSLMALFRGAEAR